MNVTRIFGMFGGNMTEDFGLIPTELRITGYLSNKGKLYTIQTMSEKNYKNFGDWKTKEQVKTFLRNYDRRKKLNKINERFICWS